MFTEGGPHFEEIGISGESGPSLVHAPRLELGADNEDESVEISGIFPENAPINFAIASYFREKGPNALVGAYKHMSEDAKKSLKHAIAEGDLQSVIHHIEMNDAMNLK